MKKTVEDLNFEYSIENNRFYVIVEDEVITFTDLLAIMRYVEISKLEGISIADKNGEFLIGINKDY